MTKNFLKEFEGIGTDLQRTNRYPEDPKELAYEEERWEEHEKAVVAIAKNMLAMFQT